jgi:dTDP-4-dehydrorhamnose reductase
MRILVLGGSGMAGHTITLYFKENGHDVTAFTTKPFPFCENIVGNALDFEKLDSIIRLGNYDVIINCVGILNQYAEEKPGIAKRINSDLPHFIADTVRGLPCKLIHMSTDCVFAGNTGPYKEYSVKDGISVYDKTKADGEVVDDKNLTFRNSIIGPDLKKEGIGLFNWFMKQTGRIEGYTGAIWTGVTTLTLAQAMEAAIRQNLCGLYNLVNNTSISKFELLCLFNKYCKLFPVSITPSDKLHLDKTLVCTRTDFDFTVPSYEQMIIEMKDWIYSHKNIYPDYYYL